MRISFTDNTQQYAASEEEDTTSDYAHMVVKFSIFIFVVLLVNYLNLQLIHITSDRDHNIELFYPLTGLYITYSLVSSRREIYAIFIASFIVAFFSHYHLLFVFIGSLIRLCIYLLVNYLAKVMDFDRNSINPNEMKKLAFLSTISIVSLAFLLSLSLITIGHSSVSLYPFLVSDYIIGDGLGVLVATPLSLYVMYPLYRSIIENYGSKTLTISLKSVFTLMKRRSMLGLLGIITYIGFIWWIIHLLDLYLLFLVLLIPLIFISVYYSFKTTVITNTLIGLVAIELIKFHQHVINSVAIQLEYGIVIFLTLLVGVLFENQRVINAELAKSQASLLRAEKLQLMKKIAASTAHDFKNIFFAISGFNELQNLYINNLPKDTANLESMVKSSHQIEKSIFRGVELVNQLMASSQELEVVAAEIDITPIMEQIYTKYVGLISKKIKLELNLEPRKFVLNVNQLNFEHMIHNLIDNAVESIDRTGTITLSTKTIKQNLDGLSQADFMMIEIADTGCGISISEQSRVFEPFFTTKTYGLGTGLSFVKEMVETHKGMLEMDTSENKGTIIKIYLPIMSEELSPIDIQRPKVEFSLSNARIVILDDDPELVNLYTSYLEAKKMKATVFTDPEEFIEYVEFNHENIDLIISDILLSNGVNGINLRNELITTFPNLEFLFITAYFKQFTDNYEFLDPDHLLTKPFSYDDLSKKIRKLLANKIETHN